MLQELSGLMQESGFGPDHPWCMAVAASLAAHPAGPAAAADTAQTAGMCTGSQPKRDAAGVLFNVHALLVATCARIVELEVSEDRIDTDDSCELRRLIQMSARDVLRIGCAFPDNPASWGAVSAGQLREGGAA